MTVHKFVNPLIAHHHWSAHCMRKCIVEYFFFNLKLKTINFIKFWIGLEIRVPNTPVLFAVKCKNPCMSGCDFFLSPYLTVETKQQHRKKKTNHTATINCCEIIVTRLITWAAYSLDANDERRKEREKNCNSNLGNPFRDMVQTVACNSTIIHLSIFASF